MPLSMPINLNLPLGKLRCVPISVESWSISETLAKAMDLLRSESCNVPCTENDCAFKLVTHVMTRRRANSCFKGTINVGRKCGREKLNKMFNLGVSYFLYAL